MLAISYYKYIKNNRHITRKMQQIYKNFAMTSVVSKKYNFFDNYATRALRHT